MESPHAASYGEGSSNNIISLLMRIVELQGSAPPVKQFTGGHDVTCSGYLNQNISSSANGHLTGSSQPQTQLTTTDNLNENETDLKVIIITKVGVAPSGYTLYYS